MRRSIGTRTTTVALSRRVTRAFADARLQRICGGGTSEIMKEVISRAMALRSQAGVSQAGVSQAGVSQAGVSQAGVS